jgi:hypothetical protein
MTNIETDVACEISESYFRRTLFESLPITGYLEIVHVFGESSQANGTKMHASSGDNDCPFPQPELENYGTQSILPSHLSATSAAGTVIVDNTRTARSLSVSCNYAMS